MKMNAIQKKLVVQVEDIKDVIGALDTNK